MNFLNLITLFLIGSIINSCSSSTSETNIEGNWRLDSVQDFNNNSYVNSYTEMTGVYTYNDKTFTCCDHSFDTLPKPYSIEESESGELTMKITSDGEEITSAFEKVDDDHFTLKMTKEGGYSIWFYHRISDNELESICN